MSTAIIISGQVRSFDQVWKNNYWMVYRKISDPVFFVSIADDEDASKIELLYERYSKDQVFIERVKQPEIPEPDPKLMLHGGYQPSTTAQGILKQIWHFNRAWEFFKKNEGGMSFKSVYRMRTDLHFHWCHLPNHSELIIREPFPSECLTPWWSRWAGINDRMALMGYEAAQAYFTTFTRLDEMLKAGCPLHPESLMAYSLESQGCVSRQTLRAWFTTVRKNGERINPDPQWPDVVDFLAAIK